jgi:hypothetical protein
VSRPIGELVGALVGALVDGLREIVVSARAESRRSVSDRIVSILSIPGRGASVSI